MPDMEAMLHMDRPSSKLLFHNNPPMVVMGRVIPLRYFGALDERIMVSEWPVLSEMCCMRAGWEWVLLRVDRVSGWHDWIVSRR